jgi:hypothetical protein
MSLYYLFVFQSSCLLSNVGPLSQSINWTENRPSGHDHGEFMNDWDDTPGTPQNRARHLADISKEYWEAQADLLRIFQQKGDIIPARNRLRAARAVYDSVFRKVAPPVVARPQKNESKSNVSRAATHRFKDKD